MTTPPPPAAAPEDVSGIDQQLADVCQTSGDYLAGLIAHGMLDTAGRPGKLPELMWPDADQELVRAVWEAALAVGYRAGKTAGTPKWTADALDRLRHALADAGYAAMANLAARSAAVHHPTLADGVPLALWDHPADHDQHQVRDGGHA